MIQVPDPSWKTDPDIVADESFEARYEWDRPARDDSDDCIGFDTEWSRGILARNNRGGF